jgi:hypothetical protein
MEMSGRCGRLVPSQEISSVGKPHAEPHIALVRAWKPTTCSGLVPVRIKGIHQDTKFEDSFLPNLFCDTWPIIYIGAPLAP